MQTIPNFKNTTPPNIQALVADLVDAGLSTTEIGASVGASAASIERYKFGDRQKRIAYPVAWKIIQLHRRVIGRNRRGLEADSDANSEAGD